MKIVNVDSCLEKSLKAKKRGRKSTSKSHVIRSETPYPAMSSTEKKEMAVGSAATFQDFVDIFCEHMWKSPNGVQIVDYLKVLFRGHQAKYGKKIVPDSQLEILLRTAALLPNEWDKSDDSVSFVKNINQRGWYKIENVVSKDELMLVAIMSLSVYNFSTIKNRHGWSVAKEQKQNRCVFYVIN